MNANVLFRFKLTFYMSTSDLVAMYGCNEPFITYSSMSTKLTHAKKNLIPFHLAQAWRSSETDRTNYTKSSITCT